MNDFIDDVTDVSESTATLMSHLSASKVGQFDAEMGTDSNNFHG